MTQAFHRPIFVFDLDGVIIDTVEALFETYLEFLRAFGKIGTREEFDSLNGPKLAEIVARLKQRHSLPHDTGKLAVCYSEMASRAYHKAKLVDGIPEILKFIRKNSYPLALASASQRENIDFVLKKFRLDNLFDFVVSGDDVKRAKPFPDIYLKVRNHFGDRRYVVVEDSPHGIEAARAAGMSTILYAPFRGPGNDHPDFTIRNFREERDLFSDLMENCRGFRISSPLEVLEPGPGRGSPRRERQVVDRVWKGARERNSSLFNGDILCYDSHQDGTKEFAIHTFVSEYKLFYAQFIEKTLPRTLFPLAISAIVVDSLGRTLIGRRGKTSTEYPSFLEFVPSGGISDIRIKDRQVDWKKQVKVELREEAGIPAASIRSILPFCLLFDLSNQVYDLGCLIRLKGPLKSGKVGDEHSSFKIVRLKTIPSLMKKNHFISTSRRLFQLFSADPRFASLRNPPKRKSPRPG